MDRLLAQDAIQSLVLRFNQAEDALDFTLLQSCFFPGGKFTLDLSEHISGMPATNLTALEFWQQVQATIPGFTATHHQLGPLRFEFHDDKYTRATASTTIEATYSLQQEGGEVSAAIVKGRQYIDVELVEGQWVLKVFKVVRDVPMENLQLFGMAAERVQKGIKRSMRS